MKYALPLTLVLLMAVPVAAHDHQWHYDQSEWAADLARGKTLVRLADCDAALVEEARRQFAQMDQQTLPVYLRVYPSLAPAPAPASAQPLPPPPGGMPGLRR